MFAHTSIYLAISLINGLLIFKGIKMANQIGLIKAIMGTVVATAAADTQRNLQVGDHVSSDEIITTAGNGAVEIEFSDGSMMALGRNSQTLLDNDFSPQQSTTQVSVDNDVEDFQQTLLEGSDPTQAGEPTAAGSDTQNNDNEGLDIVQVSYEQQFVEPTSGFITSGVGQATLIEQPDNEIAPIIAPELLGVEQSGNNQPIVSDFEPQSISGEILLNGTATTSVDYWNFTHNGGDLTVDMLTEISSQFDQNGTNGVGYNELDGDNVQSSLDIMIRVYSLNSDGSRGDEVGVNDDSSNPGFDGSLYDRDSLLSLNNLPQGDYQLVVGAWDLSADEVDSGINNVDDIDWHFEGPYQITLHSENGAQLKAKGIAFEAVDGNTRFENTLPEVTDADIADSHDYSLVANSETLSQSNPAGAIITPPTISVNSDGQYSIEGDFNSLALGETATVTFQYIADDKKGFDGTDGVNEASVSEPATVTITIQGTNDAPVITATDADTQGTVIEAGHLDNGPFVAATMAEGRLSSNDVDNNHTATWSGSSNGTYGIFVINSSTGVWTYTVDSTSGSAADQLAEGESKTETFTVTVTDDKGATATQDVTVTIVGANDAPVATIDDLNTGTQEDTSIIIDVLANDFDVDHDVINITAIQGQFVGTGQTVNVTDGVDIIGTAKLIVLDGKDQIEFTPMANYSGQVSFEYTISDGTLSDSAVVNLAVSPVADAPTLIMSIGSALPINHIVNGSFEDLDVTASWDHFNSSQINGWESNSDIEIWDHVGSYTASDGQQHMELDYSSPVDSVFQTMNLSSGAYTLTFDAANRGAMSTTNPSNDFTVLWNDQVVAFIKGSDISNGADGVWEAFTFEVNALEGANTVRFTETVNGNNSQGPLLDNVKLLSYSYDITINASLTDDSETLSQVTIPVSSLNNATIQEFPGVVSFDGTNYKVNVNDGFDTTIKLLSTTQLSVAELNTIEGSISSSEMSGTNIIDTQTTTENGLLEVNNIDNGGNSYTGTGTAANELLQGINDGNATNLIGGAGDDVLFASVGQDTLTGGTGADSFVWTKDSVDGGGAPADLIVDFTVGDNTLDLSDLLSDGSHTITGINNGGDLQVQITKVGSGIVQSIDLQGVPAGTDPIASLNNLLDDGSLNDGI